MARKPKTKHSPETGKNVSEAVKEANASGAPKGLQTAQAVRDYNNEVAKKEQEQKEAAHTEMLKTTHANDLAAVLKQALGESRDVDRKQHSVRLELQLALNRWVIAERARQTTITLVLSKQDMQTICYELADYDSRSTIDDEPNPNKSPSFEMAVNRAIEGVLVLHKVPEASIDEEGNIMVPNNLLVPMLKNKVHGKTIESPNPSKEPTIAPVAWLTDTFAKQFGRPKRGTKARENEQAAKAALVDLDKSLDTILNRVRDINANQPGKTFTPQQFIKLAELVYEADKLVQSACTNDVLLNRVIYTDKEKDNIAQVLSETKAKAWAKYAHEEMPEDEEAQAAAVG